jgi:hypothetical protein
MKPSSMSLLAVALAASAAFAQSPASAPKPAAAPAAAAAAAPSDHVKKDIARHRAMAQAHEAAARCLEAGKSEDACIKELQSACKGLAIGKYCGMRHEH